MPREFPQEKRNSQPDLDLADCPAVSPRGYLCTRNRLHTGKHNALGTPSDGSLDQWEDHQSVDRSREPNRVDDNPDR